MRNWNSVENPPNDDRLVWVKDENDLIRVGHACYYPFDVIKGEIIPLDKPTHDGTWLIDETHNFIKRGKISEFGTVKQWIDIKPPPPSTKK